MHAHTDTQPLQSYMAESRKTRIILQNQQLADMAMKLSATRCECQSLMEQLDSAVKDVAE